jgi:hypothetical protein
MAYIQIKVNAMVAIELDSDRQVVPAFRSLKRVRNVKRLFHYEEQGTTNIAKREAI